VGHAGYCDGGNGADHHLKNPAAIAGMRNLKIVQDESGLKNTVCSAWGKVILSKDTGAREFEITAAIMD
jgi:hypothetical protein